LDKAIGQDLIFGAAVSMVLFKVMREDGFFANLVCAMLQTELKLSGLLSQMILTYA